MITITQHIGQMSRLNACCLPIASFDTIMSPTHFNEVNKQDIFFMFYILF